MAVIVKLGSNDPSKRPAPKGSGSAAAQAGPRKGTGAVREGVTWFQDRRILAGAGALLVVMLVIVGVFMQAPKPVEFPQTRATVDEFDPSKVEQPASAQQQQQAPAYDPN